MATAESNDLSSLRDSLRRFAAERDWEQFHSLRNLAASISIESGELLERFQWTDPASSDLTDEEIQAIRYEIADVLLYLVRLADKLDIDLVTAGHEKIALNADKYPVDRSRGSSRKYTEL
jgi:dCTP diphosphatase